MPIKQANQVAEILKSQSSAQAKRLQTTFETFIPRAEQVIDQATRRVLHGEQVPAGEKIVPSSNLIPISFGAKKQANRSNLATKSGLTKSKGASSPTFASSMATPVMTPSGNLLWITISVYLVAPLIKPVLIVAFIPAITKSWLKN